MEGGGDSEGRPAAEGPGRDLLPNGTQGQPQPHSHALVPEADHPLHDRVLASLLLLPLHRDPHGPAVRQREIAEPRTPQPAPGSPCCRSRPPPLSVTAALSRRRRRCCFRCRRGASRAPAGRPRAAVTSGRQPGQREPAPVARSGGPCLTPCLTPCVAVAAGAAGNGTAHPLLRLGARGGRAPAEGERSFCDRGAAAAARPPRRARTSTRGGARPRSVAGGGGRGAAGPVAGPERPCWGTSGRCPWQAQRYRSGGRWPPGEAGGGGRDLGERERLDPLASQREVRRPWASFSRFGRVVCAAVSVCRWNAGRAGRAGICGRTARFGVPAEPRQVRVEGSHGRATVLLPP